MPVIPGTVTVGECFGTCHIPSSLTCMSLMCVCPQEFEVCDELLDKMMLTISIAWPIFYVILNLAYFYVQSDGGGSF